MGIIKMLSHRRCFKGLLIALILSNSLTGCMVGPDFQTPAAPKTTSYTETPLPAKSVSTPAAGSAGQSQQFLLGQDVSAEWWTLFRSPQLNALIQEGLVNSPNLAAAMSTLQQSQENLRALIGSTMVPGIDGQASGGRQSFSGSTLGSDGVNNVFNLYNASVNISYTLDAFGGLRRQIEASRAEVNYEQYQLEAAYLTLTANITTTAIQAASLKAQIKATNELIQSHQQQLKIVQRQFILGGVSKADVLSQVTQLAQTQASLPPLETSLAQTRNALATLVGRFPSDADIPQFDLDKLQLPTRIPVSLPSALVQQRPDIQASQALLHQASANVGVATANLLPQITLSGSYGGSSNQLNQLLGPNARAWNYTGGLTQPIFNGGSLLAQKRAAVDAYNVANAQYRQTVLQAFQNVADTLEALDNDAKTLQVQKRAEVAAHDSLALTQTQFELGGVSYLSLLNAEQQYQEAKISTIQAKATRYADTAALFQALGGGWWHRHDTVAAAPLPTIIGEQIND